ncbi:MULTISPECIES: hypothetical protein [unclassified Meridianimarinicoccus]|uniref:hypothetical protein n=1 Tax=unclassified Meridianimarinicoccus TaxID=2923344 RepID=UPI00186922B6|nr:hypothetical protein [Fluviibacterium sp. MJW13]
MDRTEFIIATAILLFGAFCLGFVTHWVVSRLSHVSKAALGELDSMAEALHDAEEARDAARAELKEEEVRLHGRLKETEAELKAAMEGLQTARHETEELRAFISKQNMGTH